MRALDGSEYMPGLVGLNNMSCNDYVNVIIQVQRLTALTPCPCLSSMDPMSSPRKKLCCASVGLSCCGDQ